MSVVDRVRENAALVETALASFFAEHIPSVKFSETFHL